MSDKNNINKNETILFYLTLNISISVSIKLYVCSHCAILFLSRTRSTEKLKAEYFSFLRAGDDARLSIYKLYADPSLR